MFPLRKTALLPVFLGIAVLSLLLPPSLAATAKNCAAAKYEAFPYPPSPGWDWFSDQSYYSIWTFTKTDVGETCYLYVKSALIQGTHGGSGFAKPLTFWVWIENRVVPMPVMVTVLMDNPFVPRDDSAHTSGLGWESRGVRLLPSYLCTAFKTKDLKVYYEGEPGYLTAMNKDSLWITYSR